MSSIIFAVIPFSLAFVFMIMWIRARRAALQAEVVAYGLRAHDDKDEDTKITLTNMHREYNEAIRKLDQLGQIKLDNWGRWVWTESGQQLGQG